MFTEASVKQLIAIQQDVYNRFTYMTDEFHYGVEEEWADIPDELLATGAIVGDCDDFARICMIKAQQQGFQTRLVFCRANGGGHLICEVVDPQFSQAFYFDNRQTTLVNLRSIQDYEFIMVSGWNPSRGDKRDWLGIDPAALQTLLKQLA